MAHLPHPGRLVLVLRDRLDDLVRDPAARLEEVVAGLVRVREPVLDRVVGADPLDDLSLCLCDHNHHFPSTPNSIRPAQRAISNDGTNDRSVPKRKSPASRTLFASVPHLARVRWRVDAVGPRPASWHAGPVQPSYSLQDEPAKIFTTSQLARAVLDQEAGRYRSLGQRPRLTAGRSSVRPGSRCSPRPRRAGCRVRARRARRDVRARVSRP